MQVSRVAFTKVWDPTTNDTNERTPLFRKLCFYSGSLKAKWSVFASLPPVRCRVPLAMVGGTVILLDSKASTR